MDHLPPPIDGNRVKVPFYARQMDYQPVDFHRLPVKYGYKMHQLIEHGLDSQMDPKEANEFLQSWLFFALLAQVLDRTIPYQDFCDHSGDRLHTEGLRDLLAQWVDKEKDEARNGISREQKDRFLRTSLALAEARKFVTKHLSTHRRIDREDIRANQDAPTLDREEADGNVGLNPEMTLSLAILGETLEHSRPNMLPELLKNDLKFWRVSFSQEESWGYSVYNRNTMRKNGHCRTSIRRLEAITPSVSVMYYISAMKPTNHEESTSNCSSQVCNGRLRHHEPLHMGCDGNHNFDPFVTPRNRCERFRLPEEELVRLISAGKTPMVKFSTSTGLELTEYDLSKAGTSEDSQEPFGVVSHTWSEGILHGGVDLRGGNDRFVHQCQLAALQHTFNGLLDTGDTGAKPRNYPFYVDALCVPRNHTMQKVAIKQLRDIYLKSSSVLILDRNLLGRVKSDNFIEMNMRIRTGDWSNRLWTLQEAVLAKRLYIGLANGATVGTDELLEARNTARSKPAHEFHHVWKGGHPFSLPVWKLRTGDGNIEDPSTSMEQSLTRHNFPTSSGTHALGQENRVARVWQAVQWRSVSHPQDEAVVLASVLGLDVEVIQAIGEGEKNEDLVADMRMAKLLDLIEEDPTLGIPSGIIFLPGPKLPVPGYRWAPKTWLSKQSHPYSLFRPLRKTALSTKRGVVVTFPGLVLHCSVQVPKTTFYLPLHETLHKWFKIQVATPEEDWSTFWRTNASALHELCIVMSVSNPRDRWEIGDLVRTKGSLNQGQVKWVEVLARVWIRLETDFEKLIELRREYKEQSDKLMFGSRVKDDQMWCVDRA
jgi:hypothetical protein